jgi:hypothetical protein
MTTLNNDSKLERLEEIADQKVTLKICRLNSWEKYFGEPKRGTLDYLALRRNENGFNKCVRKINGRLYLLVDETFKYFEALGD